MKSKEKIGIWMDHSEAHLIEFSLKKPEIQLIYRDHESMEANVHKYSEKQANNRKRNNQEAFYKRIWDVASDYDEVLLFGPTEAKSEFFNHIRSNRANDRVSIALRNKEKMTPDEMHDFVYHYFKPIMLP